MMSTIFLLTLLVPSYSIIIPNKDCFLKNTIYNRGHAIGQRTLASVHKCQEWCSIMRLCTHFSFSTSSHTCFLRQGDKSEPMQGFISGPKQCHPIKEEDAVMCSGHICLGGMSTSNSGNVMVDDKPVCDDDWGLEDAAVVCRQLGFPGVERATKESEFGSVSSTFSMDNVKCRGNETAVTDCYHKTADDCDGTEAAGVVCAQDSLDIHDDCREDDKLCLVGGASGSGNVYYAGHPVCHNGWDFSDANVVCRELGFSGADNFTLGSHFGLASTYSILTNFKCRGDENRLLSCQHKDKDKDKKSGIDECGTDTVAGVVCVGSYVVPESVGGHLETLVGVSLAFLVLVIVAGIVLVWRRSNIKLRSSIGLRNIEFSNPIVENFENPVMTNIENPVIENIENVDTEADTHPLC